MPSSMNPSDSQEASSPSSNEAAQYTRLVKGKELAELDASPKVVPWTLDDFAQQEANKHQQRAADIEREVQASIADELDKQKALLQQNKFEEAYQEGYEKGFAVGKEEGVEVGKAQAYSETRDFIFPKLQNLEQILQDLSDPYQKLETHLLHELTQFAVHIAQKVVLQTIRGDQSWILNAVEQAVKKLPDSGESEQPVQVLLNPDDLAFLQNLQDSDENAESLLKTWQLSASAEISAGSCLVKQGFSSVHNDWQARFDQITDEVLTQTSKSDHSDKAENLTDSQTGSSDTPVDNVPVDKMPSDQN